MENVFGKKFDYGKSIPNLDRLGIDDDGSFTQLDTNIDGLGKYVDIGLKGPKMGRNYFLYSGKCSGGDDDDKDKYTYFRNIPAGKTILGSHYKGIVPGIFEDLGQLNPIKLIAPLFVSPPKKSLSDYDQKTESNCKKIKRKEMECRYSKFTGAKHQSGGGYCKSVCTTKRVSKSYDECDDVGTGSFCSTSDEKKVNKRCDNEDFQNYSVAYEQFKNAKEVDRWVNNLLFTILIACVFIYVFG